MVNVVTQIQINKPVEQVADFVSNPDNAPKWYANIKSVIWKTGKPLVVGSKIAFRAHFLSRELVYTYEVMDYVKNEKLMMSTLQGPFPMMTTYTWSQTDNNSCRMILRNQGIPMGFSKMMAPFMSLMMKKANRKDLKLLKYILESE